MTDHIDAHALCTRNREQLKNSRRCGCFFCMEIFDPREITEWIEEQTAICPYCEIDSVIYETPRYPLTKEFLTRMNKYWF